MVSVVGIEGVLLDNYLITALYSYNNSRGRGLGLALSGSTLFSGMGNT